MSGTRSCFQGKVWLRKVLPGRAAWRLHLSEWMSATPAPRPGPAADACPLPDRALASVLLPRVVVIYILSVYINLSAAALAALLQSACLLCSLGDFPHRRLGAACPGAGGGEPGPPGSCALRSNNKRLWRGRPRRLVPDLERRGARGRGGSATLRG